MRAYSSEFELLEKLSESLVESDVCELAAEFAYDPFLGFGGGGVINQPSVSVATPAASS